MPLDRSRRKMSIRPPRDHRNNPRHSNLSALFNRPLHAIKLEDGKNKSQIGRSPYSDFFSQHKLHALIRDRK